MSKDKNDLSMPGPPPPPKNVVQKRNINYPKIEGSIDATLKPPQAVDLEEVILGALMIDKNAQSEIISILSYKVFYKKEHGIIFNTIKYLYENKLPIDLLTVSQELFKKGKLKLIGGDFYLISLTNKVSSSAHTEFHSRVVLQKYILRTIINLSRHNIEVAYRHDADAILLLDSVLDRTRKLYNEIVGNEGTNASRNDVAEQLKKELTEKVENVNKGLISGFLTHIEEFDEWSGGFQPTELVTIAARPSMGKTTIVLAIAIYNAFSRDIPCAFFSLEMSNSDVNNKVAGSALRINYKDIRQGKLTPIQKSKVIHYYDVIAKSNLYIYDTSTHKNYFHNIENKIRELVNEGVKLVFIDYVQLIKLGKSSGNDTTDLSTITRALKALANELKICIVILAQLNRQVENRPDKRPNLSDLKQSGSIEEDSDVVIFLLRKAYYEMQSKPDMILPMRELGKTEFIVAKGRHIGVRTFTMYLNLLTCKISSNWND